jgi:hypothetical protein
MTMFSAKEVGNFGYLVAITSWRQRELDRLDQYWCQGFKTTCRLNESTADHPWTTPKNMTGMGYTTTLTVLSHGLHTHIERCMKTEDVARQTKDWSTSPNFIQWQEHQTTKVIPSPETRELIRNLIGNSRGRTMGGGTVPTGTYVSVPGASNGMGPTKPSPSRSTETGKRKND